MRNSRVVDFMFKAIAMASLVVGLIVGPGEVGYAGAAPPSPYQLVQFFDLANFDYNPKERWEVFPHKVENTIPAKIKALDGKKIEIDGLIMQLDVVVGGTRTFMLAVSQDVCGFGATPRINEWMYVTMAEGRRVVIQGFEGYRVKGTLQVREQVEDGRVVGLYTMVADSVQ